MELYLIQKIYIEYIQKYMIQKNIKKIQLSIIVKEYFKNVINWTKEEFANFYQENAETVLSTANIMTGADIVLNKLKDKFELIVVTSRNDFETNIAKEKLAKLGLGDIKIFNNEHHKIDKLKDEKVDYIIDDDDNICINASDNNICALYFKNNASNRIEKDNVINVNNWCEIYKFLILSNKERID